MKYIGKAEVVTGLLVVLCMVGFLSGGYNYEEPLGPDIIEGLMQIPPHVAKQYGKTDKVRLVSNIAELLTAFRGYEVRIKALEQLVKKLEAQIDSTEKTNLLKSQIEINTERIESMAWLTKITFHDEDGKMTGGWDPNEVAK